MSKNVSIKTFNANGLFLHHLKTFVFHILGGTKRVNNFWSEKPFWILSVSKVATFFIFLRRKLFWLCRSICFWENSLVKAKLFFAEKFLVYGKLSWLWRIFSMTGEKFHDGGIFFWLRETSLTLEKFLDCGKVPWLRKSSLIKENLLSWLQKN